MLDHLGIVHISFHALALLLPPVHVVRGVVCCGGDEEEQAPHAEGHGAPVPLMAVWPPAVAKLGHYTASTTCTHHTCRAEGQQVHFHPSLSQTGRGMGLLLERSNLRLHLCTLLLRPGHPLTKSRCPEIGLKVA